ncbi:MAG: GNAT family N-acetyltransferase, partial [Flavobacteriia bacterium]|nr:GNAT family N-acetyltransferase [Flavobacteriia bacterium]
ARWAVIEKTSKKFIGWAGWKFMNYEINGHSNHYDLGYRFLENEWNKGYASESVKALIEYGKTKFDPDKLHAYTNAQNKVSNHILEKHGFDLIETFVDEDGDNCNWYKLIY